MKISLFGVSGIALGKHNVKDPRLDQADKLVEAQKKAYTQVDVVEEKEMLTADELKAISAHNFYSNKPVVVAEEAELAAPEALDLSREPEAILALYGVRRSPPTWPKVSRTLESDS